MRRFWAHIVLAFAALAGIAATASFTVSKLNSNIEYTNGKEITFRITNKGDEQGTGLSETATDDVIRVMEDRLTKSGVSYYEIEKADTSADHTESFVKVRFASNSEALYSQVAFYLTYDGTMALSDNSEANDNALMKDIMSAPAYYEAYNGGYPAVIIPIDNSPSSTFDTLYNEAKENGVAETQTEGEGEDAVTTSTKYLYMWYSFNAEKDSFTKTQETLSDGTKNPEYDGNVAARLSSLKFNIENDNIFYPDGNKDKIFCVLNVGDGENIGMNDLRNGFQTAKYLTNLINAEQIDHKIEVLNSTDMKIVSPLVESIKTSDQLIAWSRTFIAVLCAILIISLLLAVFFKLGALSVGVITLLSTYLSFVTMVGLGAEFSTAAIMGLILVTIASLASGVVYLNKLKEECYKGRTLKKANAEASKKSLLVTLDIHLAIIVTGVFIYLFAGQLFRSFGLITIVGGLISFVLNALGLKAMMWLATNTTKFIGRYDLFGIEKDQVPNHMADEKQSFYGQYEKVDFTKNKKPVAILSGVLLVASLAGIITFGSINNGRLFNSGDLTNNSEIYLVASSRNSEDNPFNETVAKEMLNDVDLYVSGSTESKKLSSYIASYEKDVTSFTYVDKPDNTEGESEVVIYNFYYIVKLNKILDADNTYVTSSMTTTLNEYLKTSVETLNENGRGFVYQDTKVVTDVPDWSTLALGSFVAVATMFVYLSLRYKLSRGLVSLIAPTAVGLVTIGILTLTRVVATNYALAALPIITAFTLIISIIFMNKEKEMVSEDRNRAQTFESRNELMVRANSLAFYPIMITTILSGYIAVNFFGFGPASLSLLFFVMVLGIVMALAVVSILYGPLAQVFYKLLSKISIDDSIRPNKKKAKKVVHKSAEPEEATFIGIND